jgi:hypothetical protein
VLRFRTADPLTYAADWLRPTEDRDPAGYARRLDAWLAHYRAHGMNQLSAGAVILRRRAASANWLRADTMPGGEHVGDCGAQIERVFTAEDFLQTVPDDRALLDGGFRLHEDHVAEQRLALREGRWAVQSLTLRPSQGIVFTGNVDAQVLRLLQSCDGQRPLRETVAELAQSLETDFAATASVCADVVRKLLRAGLLEPSARAVAAS